MTAPQCCDQDHIYGGYVGAGHSNLWLQSNYVCSPFLAMNMNAEFFFMNGFAYVLHLPVPLDSFSHLRLLN